MATYFREVTRRLCSISMFLYLFVGSFFIPEMVNLTRANVFDKLYFRRDDFDICPKVCGYGFETKESKSSLILDHSGSDNSADLFYILCGINGVFWLLTVILPVLPKPETTLDFMMGPSVMEVTNMAYFGTLTPKFRAVEFIEENEIEEDSSDEEND